MKKKSAGTIEVLARGVCVQGGNVLLCHRKGAWNTFLPGGHVEFNESSIHALTREIREELGRATTVGRFLGAVEHSFRQDGIRHCEVNLVFEMRVPGLIAGVAPDSREGKIEFEWFSLSSLGRSNLEPRPLIRLLSKWLGKAQFLERWESSLRRGDRH